MIKHLIVAAAIAAGGLATTPITFNSAEAHSPGRSVHSGCKTGIVGRAGIAVKKSKAEKRARRKWSFDARQKYGGKYNYWPVAEGKHYHCKKKHGTWRCSAAARPCEISQAQ